MFSTTILVSLLILSGMGILLGAFYYFKPEKIVNRRVKSSHWKMAREDAEFKKWLKAEIETQMMKTRRIGMIIIVLEAIWMVLILGLWQRG